MTAKILLILSLDLESITLPHVLLEKYKRQFAQKSQIVWNN